MAALLFIRSYWPFFVIAALLFVVLFYRGDHIKMKAERDAAQVEAASLREINEQNAESFKRMADAAKDNARISAAVAADVAKSRANYEAATQSIREAARNDPTVNDWYNSPVPGVVRNALENPN